MKGTVSGPLASVLILSVTPSVGLAYHCPKLVAECGALVAKMEKRMDTNRMTAAGAKKGCEEALRLHKAGKHKEAIIKAGEAISLAGSAVK